MSLPRAPKTLSWIAIGTAVFFGGLLAGHALVVDQVLPTWEATAPSVPDFEAWASQMPGSGILTTRPSA